jgi:heme O synthase-like polyprenyltransferase
VILPCLIVLESDAFTPSSWSISAISDYVPAPMLILRSFAAFLALAAATSIDFALVFNSWYSASNCKAVSLAAPYAYSFCYLFCVLVSVLLLDVDPEVVELDVELESVELDVEL